MNNLVSLALFYKVHQNKNSVLLEMDEVDYSYNVLLELRPNQWKNEESFTITSAWDKAYLFFAAPDLADHTADLADLLSQVFKNSRPTTLYLLFADRVVRLDLTSVKSFSSVLESDQNKTLYF